MTPDKLPQEIADKIKSDATAYSDIPRCIAYTQGATAWATWKVKHDELQVQAQRMADTLEQCSNVASWMDDPYRNKIIEIVSKALQQFKDGKGKEKKLHSGNKHQWQDDWDLSEQGELNEETE